MAERSPADVSRDELRSHSSHRFRLFPGTEVRVTDVRGDEHGYDVSVEVNNFEIAGSAERVLEFARVLESVVQQTIENPDRVGPFRYDLDRPYRLPRSGFSGLLE